MSYGLRNIEVEMEEMGVNKVEFWRPIIQIIHENMEVEVPRFKSFKEYRIHAEAMMWDIEKSTPEQSAKWEQIEQIVIINLKHKIEKLKYGSK